MRDSGFVVQFPFNWVFFKSTAVSILRSQLTAKLLSRSLSSADEDFGRKWSDLAPISVPLLSFCHLLHSQGANFQNFKIFKEQTHILIIFSIATKFWSSSLSIVVWLDERFVFKVRHWIALSDSFLVPSSESVQWKQKSCQMKTSEILFLSYWFWLIPKTIGNRKRDCAWGCARRINTTSENLQIEKHKSGRRSFRSPDWFVLFDLQIFWGGVYPPSATSRTISEGWCSRKFDRLFRCFDPLSRHLTEAKRRTRTVSKSATFLATESVIPAPFKRGETKVQIFGKEKCKTFRQY